MTCLLQAQEALLFGDEQDFAAAAGPSAAAAKKPKKEKKEKKAAPNLEAELEAALAAPSAKGTPHSRQIPARVITTTVFMFALNPQVNCHYLCR